MILRVKYGQRSIQVVPLSRTDMSLHNSAAFRPLLLFRLHVDGHQALTSPRLSLVLGRRRHYFSLTYAVGEARALKAFVWTLCMINGSCLCRQNANKCVGEAWQWWRALAEEDVCLRRGLLNTETLTEAPGRQPSCESFSLADADRLFNLDRPHLVHRTPVLLDSA